MAKDKDDQLDELRDIKKLLILQLLRQGVKQVQIATMLGISEATMSRILPKGIGRIVAKGTASSAGDGAVN